MNFTDYSRSDVCCYSSLVDNAMLCNDRGGTLAVSDLLFIQMQSFRPKYYLVILTDDPNKTSPCIIFM